MSESSAQPTAPQASPVRRSTLIACGVALAAIAGAAWWLDDVAPTARWQDGDGQPLAGIAKVGTEQTFTLTVDLPRPMHVYVASHDLVRGTLAMFPSAALRSELVANPLPAGPHVLPGTQQQRELLWHAGDGVGLSSVILIASEEPLPELDAALASCRQVGNAAFPDRPILGAYAPESGMDTAPPRSTPAHPLLAECARLIDHGENGALLPVPGRSGVYATVLRLHTELALGGNLEEARRQIAEEFGPLLEGTLPMPAGAGPDPQNPAPMGPQRPGTGSPGSERPGTQPAAPAPNGGR